jgi:type IX secretion system PorP/SprF family membrane protein
MRKIFTTVIATFTAVVSFAQQDPQFSQNMFNRLFPNPAYAGSNDAICGTLLYRDQWDKFGGGPKSAVLGVDAPIEVLHGGLGLSFLSDKPGYEKNLNLKLAYAFRFDVGSGKLAIGLDGGLLQRGYDGTQFRPADPTDNKIPNKSVSASKFDLGAGIYYNSEKVYIGASASHLTEGTIDFDVIKTKVVRHYYFMGGVNLDLTPDLSLRPSVFVKTDATETQADINANLMIKNKFWIGGSYRIKDAIVAMAGFNLTENFKVGYAFDITTSDIKTYSSGTHEIMLGYCYKIKKKVLPVIRNVRFL